jgi:hypothetical protein
VKRWNAVSASCFRKDIRTTAHAFRRGSCNAGHAGRSHVFRLVAQAWQTLPFLCTMRARLVHCFSACLRDHMRIALTQRAPADAVGPASVSRFLHKPLLTIRFIVRRLLSLRLERRGDSKYSPDTSGWRLRKAIGETRYAGSDGAASEQHAQERSFSGSKVQVIRSREKYRRHRVR